MTNWAKRATAFGPQNSSFSVMLILKKKQLVGALNFLILEKGPRVKIFKIFSISVSANMLHVLNQNIRQQS